MSQERVGTFLDQTTCWEEKTNQLLHINEKEEVCCKHQEIPSFTRILESKAKLVFIETNQQKFSLKGVEIKLKENQIDPPNSEINPLTVIKCFTPITNQFVGFALFSATETISKIYQNRTTESEKSNCIILPDIANNWFLHIYTTKHIKKGETLRLFHVGRSQISNDVIAPLDLQKVRAISPWLPQQLHFLAEYFYSFVVDHKLEVKTKSQNNFAAWQLYILIYVLRMFTDPKKNKIHHLVTNFNQTYSVNRQSSPFLLQSLFIEGLINTKTNSKWFSYFTAQSLLNAKSTNTRIE